MGSIGLTLSFGVAGALTALGDTKSNRSALSIGFFANLTLNPLFTFGFGVTGLALATVLIKLARAFYAYVVVFQSVAVLQAMQKPMFPMYLGIAGQLVIPGVINYVLIVRWGYPMVLMFYTTVIVVIISAVVAY